MALPMVKCGSSVFKLTGTANAKQVGYECLRDDRPSHGRSLASDPHGYWKCHYDVWNIIDHAITAFVSPLHQTGRPTFV
jgi:alpha-beta hydrolase superfamily lysophospholipase